MKAHLAFDHLGINHSTQLNYWSMAVKALGWEIAELEKADFTVMWGPNPQFEETRARGKPVLMIDFPYWNRGGKERTGAEYYKVSLNGQHPTPYIFTESHGPDRYRNTNGPAIMPWQRQGRHIVLAGMGVKASVQHGYGIGEWEAKIAAIIRKQTDKPIYYRPKPRQTPIVSIPGTIPDNGELPVEDIIKGAHCVVCHHGNPTIQALAMGVPIFMNGAIGAASHLASFDFSKILSPVYLDNRQKFFNNISHWQWSVGEITTGRALKSYHERGFI